MVTALKDIPTGALIAQCAIPETAAATDVDLPVFYAYQDCKILVAGFIPSSDMTAHGTNYLTMGCLDKGGAGAGATGVGTDHVMDTPTDDDIADWDYQEIIALTDEVTLDQGDVLSFFTTNAGGGLQLEAGMFVVVYWPTAEA